MNWEDSNACTPLKRDFLHAWFAQERRFFLTGGSALGLFYLDHRRSYDLDFFTSDEVEAKEVQNLVHRVAARIDSECHAIQSAPDFHRFRLVLSFANRPDGPRFLDAYTAARVIRDLGTRSAAPTDSPPPVVA